MPAPLSSRLSPAVARPGMTTHTTFVDDVVHKRFASGDPERDRLAAEWEYERLCLAQDAFRGLSDVSAPKPLSLTAHPPGIRMARCAGVPLSAYLLHHAVPDGTLAALGAGLATGLSAYVDRTLEPYFDFALSNVLYDADTGHLTLHDFGRPKDGGVWMPDATPLTVSLGNFLGWLRYELSRPVRWARPRVRRQYLGCYLHLVAHLKVTRHDFPSETTLLRFARLTYGRLGFTGPPTRRAWYHGVDVWRSVFLDPTLHD